MAIKLYRKFGSYFYVAGDDVVPKITDEPVVKFELTLFASDYEYLKSLYGPQRNLSVSKVIRLITRTFVRQLKARTSANIDQIENLDLVTEEAEP